MRTIIRVCSGIGLALLLTACGGGSVIAPLRPTPAPTATPPPVPAGFECIPSGLSGATSANRRTPQIAYAASCNVGTAAQSAALQSMAVSLMYGGTSGYSSYCSGTPISYNAATHIGFVVTAAHCIVGGSKAAGALVTPSNITTFDSASPDATGIYQGTPGMVSNQSALTGQIQAIYIPTQYCTAPPFSNAAPFGCVGLDQQNGDIAVLKVLTTNGNSLAVSPLVQLAPTSLVIPTGSELLALGYGSNNGSQPNSAVLYYVSYQYYADNSYQGQSGEASIMNGYYANNRYYSIICQGDSGGPDLYWDGTMWNLIGAHSFGPNPCGVSAPTYAASYDVSADIRPFTAWIKTIVAQDTNPTGCANLGSQYVCNAR